MNLSGSATTIHGPPQLAAAAAAAALPSHACGKQQLLNQLRFMGFCMASSWLCPNTLWSEVAGATKVQSVLLWWLQGTLRHGGALLLLGMVTALIGVRHPHHAHIFISAACMTALCTLSCSDTSATSCHSSAVALKQLICLGWTATHCTVNIDTSVSTTVPAGLPAPPLAAGANQAVWHSHCQDRCCLVHS